MSKWKQILLRLAGKQTSPTALIATIDDGPAETASLDDIVSEAQSLGEQYRDSDRDTVEKVVREIRESGRVDHRFWRALSDYFWSNGPADYSLLPSEFYLETQRDVYLFFRAGEMLGVRGGNEARRVHYLEQAVQCDVSSPREHLVVGDSFSRLRRWVQAFEAYEAGLTVAPDDSELWRSFAATSIAAHSVGRLSKCIDMHRVKIIDIVAAMPPHEVVNFVKLLRVEGEAKLNREVSDFIIRGLAEENPSNRERLVEYIVCTQAVNDFEFRDQICEGVIDSWSHKDGEQFRKGIFAVKLAKLFSPPLVFEHAFDDEQFVRDFCSECEELMQEAVVLNEPIADLARCAPWVSMYTRAVPHLYSDAALAIHNLAARVWPKLLWTAPHIAKLNWSDSRKIKIGFTCLDFMPMISGLMGKLDRKKFETIYLRPDYPEPVGEVGKNWIARADRAVNLPVDSVYAIQEAIAAEELDIIVAGPSLPSSIYPMMARLAPLQMVIIEPNWCDSFTNMDYYISWGAAEPSAVKAYHKNAVALMEHPPYWMEKPSPSDRPVASVIDALAEAPAHKRVYLCPTSPAKLHPAFDDVLKKVLSKDPEGIVVFLRMDNHWGNTVRNRIDKSLGSMADRIIYLPGLKPAEAHALLNSVDCVLDAYPLGGMSSSFVAAAVGTPTVTMPKEMPFGKWMSAVYRYIDVDGLTAASADEYADIAFRLATDATWRKEKGAELRSKGHIFIESEAAATEFEAFILEAWKRHAEGLRPTDWANSDWVENTA